MRPKTVVIERRIQLGRERERKMVREKERRQREDERKDEVCVYVCMDELVKKEDASSSFSSERKEDER